MVIALSATLLLFAAQSFQLQDTMSLILAYNRQVEVLEIVVQFNAKCLQCTKYQELFIVTKPMGCVDELINNNNNYTTKY